MSRLLWKLLLSTSGALTTLFLITGWILQQRVSRITEQSLQAEVESSFRAYQSLWRTRAEKLAAVSLVLSRMSDVRAAFSTGDRATIRDTAGEVWSKLAEEDALFAVTDPRGAVLACLGGPCESITNGVEAVAQAASKFPGQASGFIWQDERLEQIVLTPVYVDSPRGPALLNVLVAGYVVNPKLANALKDATGSDFVFRSQDAVVASTLPAGAPLNDYATQTAPLLDIAGKPAGELTILRSLEAARRRVNQLRRDILLIWIASLLIGLLLTYALARLILRPVEELDRAAAGIARGNYDTQVAVNSHDELGRLAKTFNEMGASLREARQRLIHQERISTIGRLSTSIVHDLRNPLAAIYGGAEMLVDGELPPSHVQRLASNIYRSSRRVQELLQDLSDVTRGKTQGAEVCLLIDLIRAAVEPHLAATDARKITIECTVDAKLELPLERSRMERVFGNLLTNAIDAIADGGHIWIRSSAQESAVVVEIADDGPGIAPAISARLFEPFVTAGKKNGLGLGLALSRQTVTDHGGDMWVRSSPGQGAAFFVRLPLAPA